MSNAAPRMAVPLTTSASGRADFDQVARDEAPRLFGLGVAILGDHGEAEDAVQETLVRAWRNWQSLRDPAARRGWLTRICVNHCITARHRRLRRSAFPVSENLASPAAEPSAARLDQERAFGRLNREQRAIVALHFGQGYTLDECSEILGCPPGTVRSRLGRALAILRREIGHE